MKKLFQISVIIVLALALTFGLFLAAGNSDSYAGRGICPMVGWNTRCSSYVAAPTLGSQIAGLRPAKPDVGWNT